MSYVSVICTQCGKEVNVDETLEANVCPNCQKAFITEKGIKLFAEKTQGNVQTKPVKKKRHILKSLGSGLLLAVQCIGYLIYVLLGLWLFFDIVDNIKK